MEVVAFVVVVLAVVAAVVLVKRKHKAVSNGSAGGRQSGSKVDKV